MPRTATLLLSALAAVALSPSTARAEPREHTVTYLNPGPLLVFRLCCGGDFAFGAGAEVSMSHFPHVKEGGDDGLAIGGFAQFTHFFAAGGFERFSIGAQGGHLLGADVGLAYQTASRLQAGSLGFQTMPYASVGVAYLGVRFTFPGASGKGDGGSSPVYIDLVTSLKFPIRMSDSDMSSGDINLFSGGRPLHADGEVRVSGLVASADWS